MQRGIPVSKGDDYNDLILAIEVLLGDIPPQIEYTETTFVLMFCQTLTLSVSKQVSQSGLEYP